MNEVRDTYLAGTIRDCVKSLGRPGWITVAKLLRMTIPDLKQAVASEIFTSEQCSIARMIGFYDCTWCGSPDEKDHLH